jgi:antitoxin ChpS
MSVTTKIRRQGGAAVMTIPPVLLKMMNVEVGDQLSLVVSDGQLVARPAQTSRRRYTLSELLKGKDELAKLNADVADALDGDFVGRELP